MTNCSACGWGPIREWYNKIIEETYIDRRERLSWCDNCHLSTVKKEPKV